MKWLNLLGYEIKNALIGMRHHWILCFSSVFTVFLAMLLVGVFSLLGLHVDRFSSQTAEDLSIHVVLVQDVDPDAGLDHIQTDILTTPNVKTAKFSSKDQELEYMIAQKGEAFAQYREDNPLSHAYYVYVEDESLIEQTAQDLSSIEGVESVSYGGTSVSQLVKVLDMVRWVSFGFVVLLLLLAMYLIYNTIRTTIYSRSAEISIMRTVGATTSFIRVPFEIEGILIGLFGALLPYILIVVLYPKLYELLHGRLFANLFSLMPEQKVAASMALVLFGTSAAIGWLASFLSASKYIKATR